MGAGRLIFGGSFNPLHVGHLRLALETLNLMAEQIEIVEFLPSAQPPHKRGEPMLPFELRSRLIKAAIKGKTGLACNELEGSISGPSYTFNTLKFLAKESGSARLYFLLGSQDFQLLPEWRHGLELPELCSLVIAPRGDYPKKEFEQQTRVFWPKSAESIEPGPKDECTDETGWHIKINPENAIYLLPLPHLAISATRIRKLWLCGKNLDYLAPEAVLEILTREQRLVRACWQENTCSK